MLKRPPIRIGKPVGLPVTIETVREVCRLEADVSDARIADLIEVATAEFDGYSGWLGRALITQTWRQDFSLGCAIYRLPFPDVSAATAVVRHLDGSEAPATIVFDEDVIGPFVTTTDWSGNISTVLRVTFTAGYGDEPSDVPAPIREAILKRIAQSALADSEDGQIRSFAVDGAYTESFNSPEQRAAEVDKTVRTLVKPYRRGNMP